MTGLIKNNFYAALASAKWLLAALLLAGAGMLFFGSNHTLPVIYSLLCMVAFSVNAIASLRRESASKWGRYKLTLPVRRKDIVKSYFVSQLIWMLAGALLAGAGICLSFLFHGFPFDQNTDVLMIFTLGISADLLMGALFYPLFYLGGEERNEAILGISLVGAAGIITGLVWLINLLFGPKMELLFIILGTVILLATSSLLFVASYLATIFIFKKKDC